MRAAPGDNGVVVGRHGNGLPDLADGLQSEPLGSCKLRYRVASRRLLDSVATFLRVSKYLRCTAGFMDLCTLATRRKVSFPGLTDLFKSALASSLVRISSASYRNTRCEEESRPDPRARRPPSTTC